MHLDIFLHSGNRMISSFFKPAPISSDPTALLASSLRAEEQRAFSSDKEKQESVLLLDKGKGENKLLDSSAESKKSASPPKSVSPKGKDSPKSTAALNTKKRPASPNDVQGGMKLASKHSEQSVEKFVEVGKQAGKAVQRTLNFSVKK